MEEGKPGEGGGRRGEGLGGWGEVGSRASVSEIGSFWNIALL